MGKIWENQVPRCNPGELGGLPPQSRDQLTTWMTFGLSGAQWSLTLQDTLQISQVFSRQDISRCFLGKKNICNSNPNRNPCFLTEKTELSSETGKVLHHQGRQCEASEGLKFRDLTIHGVVSWQRWRLEMSTSSSRGHQFWCFKTEVFPKTRKLWRHDLGQI